ncbi:MAG: hypothetical protein H8E33_02445 [Candidatus Cloacimonetes bacterium]|nr:hypothetical protein [Candidatus Cloacimonadota bacterium]
MHKRYEHMQVGYLMLVILCIVLAFMIFFMFFYGFNLGGFFVILIIMLTLWMFSRLTVVIDSEFLRIKFGPGIIGKKFLLKDIIFCKAIKNPWYYGWGIRITPHGILYNVSGFLAVEIKMKSGKKYRIGTDEPEKLRQAIHQSIKR